VARRTPVLRVRTMLQKISKIYMCISLVKIPSAESTQKHFSINLQLLRINMTSPTEVLVTPLLVFTILPLPPELALSVYPSRGARERAVTSER
jgi:hypothetical protein